MGGIRLVIRYWFTALVAMTVFHTALTLGGFPTPCRELTRWDVLLPARPISCAVMPYVYEFIIFMNVRINSK